MQHTTTQTVVKGMMTLMMVFVDDNDYDDSDISGAENG